MPDPPLSLWSESNPQGELEPSPGPAHCQGPGHLERLLQGTCCQLSLFEAGHHDIWDLEIPTQIGLTNPRPVGPQQRTLGQIYQVPQVLTVDVPFVSSVALGAGKTGRTR